MTSSPVPAPVATGVAAHPRCDRTGAWSALHAHFEARARHFDLREAFAADARSFEMTSDPQYTEQHAARRSGSR